jgi:hypothetical protein
MVGELRQGGHIRKHHEKRHKEDSHEREISGMDEGQQDSENQFKK